jgi:hypothetical protein
MSCPLSCPQCEFDDDHAMCRFKSCQVFLLFFETLISDLLCTVKVLCMCDQSSLMTDSSSPATEQDGPVLCSARFDLLLPQDRNYMTFASIVVRGCFKIYLCDVYVGIKHQD